MHAFHGNPELKAFLVKAALKHQQMDDYVGGTYGYGRERGRFKACSIGCTIYDLNQRFKEEHATSDHCYLEKRTGIPLIILRLQDTIFEGLYGKDQSAFTPRLYKAITPGADLSKVGVEFLLAVQRRNLRRVDKQKFPDVYAVIQTAKKVLRDWLRGKLDKEAAAEVARAATAAAEEARASARSAEGAKAVAAARVMWTAARPAEAAAKSAGNALLTVIWAAEAAVEAARASAIWTADATAKAAMLIAPVWAAKATTAARSAEYRWMANKLVELLLNANERGK